MKQSRRNAEAAQKLQDRQTTKVPVVSKYAAKRAANHAAARDATYMD